MISLIMSSEFHLIEVHSVHCPFSFIYLALLSHLYGRALELEEELLFFRFIYFLSRYSDFIKSKFPLS